MGRAAAYIYKIFDCDNNAVFGQQKITDSTIWISVEGTVV